MGKKRSKLARSQRQLAKAVGRSASTVNVWVHDDRWPFAVKPPWDVDQVKTWAAATLAPEPGTDEAYRLTAARKRERREAEDREAEELLGAETMAELNRAAAEAMKLLAGQ